jgi:AsmA protein
MRALRIAGAPVGVIILVVTLVMMVGIPSDFMASAIRSRVERDTGYRLTIAGGTRISVWPTLKLTMADVTLSDPKDRDVTDRLTVASVQADMSLSSAWSGHPQIRELTINRPVLHLPLLRERLPNANQAKSAASPAADDASKIEHVTIKDGAVVFSNPRDRIENRFEGINAEAALDGEHTVKLHGHARAGEHALDFQIDASPPNPPLDHPNIPFKVTVEMPGVLKGTLTANAEARLNGSVVMINGITGKLGDGAFNGWASVDISSKPLAKLDLDFQRLEIAMQANAASSKQQGWSSAAIDLRALNYVDGQLRLSAGELKLGEAAFAPVAIDSRLAGGVFKASVTNLGAYGGQVAGEFIVDASSGSPSFAMHGDAVGVRALPVLRSLAGFEYLDGKLQAKLALRSAGDTQQLVMSNLSGSVFANFQDGAIRGLNVARMIRSLTSKTLSGWDESGDEVTDLSQLSASFRVDKGQASTTDLNLVGPLVRMTGAGTVYLGTKMLAFRVEPKLVMTTEGQGRASDPVGLGIPVVIDGPWAEPRIYPDMTGILDDPDAAYAKLREMGKGLFGANGGLGGLLGGLGAAGAQSGVARTTPGGAGSNPLGGKLGDTIGNLIQQGLGGSRGLSANPSPQGSPARPPQDDPPPQPQQDSQPMNDVLRQLFSR